MELVTLFGAVGARRQNWKRTEEIVLNVEGAGFGVAGLGFRVWGLGFRV